jgi:hypothetical protein
VVWQSFKILISNTVLTRNFLVETNIASYARWSYFSEVHENTVSCNSCVKWKSQVQDEVQEEQYKL